MSAFELLARFRDLQAYVGWDPEDAARIRSVADAVQGKLQPLIDDFYIEIQRHPEAE